MAVHGKTTGVLFDEFNLSQYLTQASLVKEAQVVDVTTFSNNDKVYVAGQGSGSIALNGIWDGGVSASDAILDAAVGTDAIITVCPQGFGTLGNAAIMLQALDAGYQQRSTVNDAVRITVNATANGGIRVAGRLLHILEAETTTENGTAVDNGASSAFGGFGHLHVTAFSGTSATVKIQDSSNGTDFSDLIEFAQVTGVGAQRLSVAGTVDRHLRYAITADDFTSMTLLVAFARNRRA